MAMSGTGEIEFAGSDSYTVPIGGRRAQR